jgi:hypothetical protein
MTENGNRMLNAYRQRLRKQIQSHDNQSAQRAFEPLGDREIRLLYEGLTLEQQPLQSVSDVALWMDIEKAFTVCVPMFLTLKLRVECNCN